MTNRCRACTKPRQLLRAPGGDLCDACVLRVCHFIARGDEPGSFWPWRVRVAPRRGERTAAETHLDLAWAYSQMGMLGDALMDGANAVLAAPQRGVIEQAWRLIVDPRLCDEPRRVYDLARRLATSSGR